MAVPSGPAISHVKFAHGPCRSGWDESGTSFDMKLVTDFYAFIFRILTSNRHSGMTRLSQYLNEEERKSSFPSATSRKIRAHTDRWEIRMPRAISVNLRGPSTPGV
jgi:hypothetical protein